MKKGYKYNNNILAISFGLCHRCLLLQDPFVQPNRAHHGGNPQQTAGSLRPWESVSISRDHLFRCIRSVDDGVSQTNGWKAGFKAATNSVRNIFGEKVDVTKLGCCKCNLVMAPSRWIVDVMEDDVEVLVLRSEQPFLSVRPFQTREVGREFKETKGEGEEIVLMMPTIGPNSLCILAQ